jgi:predicted DNA-binding transcriptional regulator YafY
MRRADRLFDIIQILRDSRKPVTAAALAEALEVTPRTVYRDVATLQARRVPIDGAAGVGYVLRRGFDLPPLMFTSDEIDAIAVGARLVRRIRDPKLQAAAERVLGKVTVMLPEALRAHLAAPPFYVYEGDLPTAAAVDLADLRAAIYESRKLHIAYVDEHGNHTERTIWPVAMAYYTHVTLIGAWCELRQDFRNFRVERIAASELLEERFTVDREKLTAEWLALPKERPGTAP